MRVNDMQVSTDTPTSLTSPQKSRLDAAFSLQPVDRTPMLGGWIADPAKILELTGASEEHYWSDPVPVSVEAYRRLGLDGLLDVNVPSERGGYTLVTHKDIEERSRYETPEDIVAQIDRLPLPEEVRQRFDEQDAYDRALVRMEQMQVLCGSDLYWCPARWEVIPNFEWYRTYGYETYLIAVAAYPDQIARLYEHSAAVAACNARVIARLLREKRHPRAMLCGMDICGQRGPLVDPGFLRERYWPLVWDAVKPLRQAGAKLVWHCDGDVRPILDDILGIGAGGLQGFQSECGVRLEEIVQRRTIDGDRLIVFGPLSVTTTLVHDEPEGVKSKVREAIGLCRDNASLVLFTSNEILPDVPMANMKAMYEAVREYYGEVVC